MKGIIKKAQAPVNKVVDKVVEERPMRSNNARGSIGSEPAAYPAYPLDGMERDLAGKFTGKDGDKDDENENDENAEKDEAWDERLVRSNNARGVIRREPKANLSGGQVESLIRLQTSAKNKEDRPMRSNNTRSVIGREPAADPLGGLEEKQMDDALRGIKSAHGFDRLTKSADGEFWEVSAKKGDKTKKLDIKADFEGKDPQETSDDPELEAKAQEGLEDLRNRAKKYRNDGASLEEAQSLVSKIKSAHPVFKVLEVHPNTDKDDKGWDVRISYNPTYIGVDLIGKEIELDVPHFKTDKGDKIGQINGNTVVVNDHYPAYFETLSDSEKEKAVQKLTHSTFEVRRKEGLMGANASEGTNELRKKVDGEQYPNFQAHHIIPRETRNDFSQFYKDIGFNIENGSINGIMLPPNKTILEQTKKDYSEIGTKYDNYAFHQGSHGNYTNKIKAKIRDVEELFDNNSITKAEALSEILDICSNAKVAIKTAGGIPINSVNP